MPLTEIDLKISHSISEDGLNVYAFDNTGLYNISSNPLGYGCPNGITSASTTSATIVHSWESLGVNITFNFTIASNVITAATITDSEGTVINILPYISTVWPFSEAIPLNLNDTAYGAVLPTIADGVMSLTYTIGGVMTNNGEQVAYSYTTSEQFIRTNDTCCCIDEMYSGVDTSCACLEDKIAAINEAEFWFNSAVLATNIGETDKGIEFLDKTNEICGDSCDEC